MQDMSLEGGRGEREGQKWAWRGRERDGRGIIAKTKHLLDSVHCTEKTPRELGIKPSIQCVPKTSGGLEKKR
jgi:hypothetical protein